MGIEIVKDMDYFAAVRTFVRAAELNSLTKAAQELGIKTSTASRHITDLETDLHIALFNRSTRGLSLTEAGGVFYKRVSVVLQNLQEARDEVSSLNLSPSGVLRVTLPTAFGRKHVVPYLHEFLTRYRDIDVETIFSDHTTNLIESRIDLAIRIGALEDSSLMARRLGAQRRVVCASPAYLRTHGTPTTPMALAAHQIIVFSLAPGRFWYFRQTSSDHAEGDEWQKIAIEGRLTVNDSDALLSAALDGIGIALLPSWLISDALNEGRLQRILPTWDVRLSRDDPSIWAVYPRKKTVSSKVRCFIDFLIEKIGDPPYWDHDHPQGPAD